MISYHRADISDTEDLVGRRLLFIRDSQPEMEVSLIDIYREPLRQYYAETIPTGECVYWLARDGEQTVGGGGIIFDIPTPGHCSPSILRSFAPSWKSSESL